MSEPAIARDAVGQPLAVGDHVAHVFRRSSYVRITRRVIAEIREHQMRWAGAGYEGSFQVRMVPLPNAKASSWAEAHNVIKVRAP